MQTSESINELAAALAKAQGEFATPKKTHTAKVTSQKGSYSYQYSTLDDLLAAVRPALKANGLAVVQNVNTPDGGTVAVSTVVIHQSGQSLAFDAVVLPSGNTPQGMGAAITYARRYSLGAALNVAAEEDDDAQSVNTITTAQQATDAVQAGYTKATQPVAVPTGYGDWLHEMELVADTGYSELEKAFKGSRQDYRDYLTKHDATTLVKLKARAKTTAVAK